MKNNKIRKGYELQYDKVSERMVLHILDPESMLPLLVKTPKAEPKVLSLTSSHKLYLTK